MFLPTPFWCWNQAIRGFDLRQNKGALFKGGAVAYTAVVKRLPEAEVFLSRAKTEYFEQDRHRLLEGIYTDHGLDCRAYKRVFR